MTAASPGVAPRERVIVALDLPSVAVAEKLVNALGDTVSFTDQHLQEHVGTIVRINQKTASIQCDPNQGHWRVSFGLLRKIVDV